VHYSLLSLLRTRDVSYTAHVNSTIAKASRAAGMLHKVIATRSMDLQVKLYTTYVRPIVEYLTVIWNPESVSLSDSVERVQRRFTKRIHGLRWLPYEERLRILELDTLSARRKHIDLITAYKALRGDLGIDPLSIGLVVSTTPTRGQNCNLYCFRPKNNIVKKVFRYRICALWNNLPESTKMSPNVKLFSHRS
jgi:hypothetical protein